MTALEMARAGPPLGEADPEEVDQVWRPIDTEYRPEAGETGRTALDPLARLATLDEIADGTETYFGEIVFDGDRFDFPDEDHSGARPVPAVLIPIRNEFGRVVDIAAFRDEQFALWVGGLISMLGEEQIAWRLGEPIRVFETPRAWLRAGRKGVCLVDWKRAARMLDGLTISVGPSDLPFGKKLRSRLTIRPLIVVETGA